MRKLTVLAALSAIVLGLENQADAAVFASELKYDNATNTLSFVLNQAATTVTVNLKNDTSGAIVKSIQVGARAKGLNTVNLTSEAPDVADGIFRWEVYTQGSPIAAVTKISDDAALTNQFSRPRGLAVDSNFESPNFGRVYVSEAVGTATSPVTISRTNTQRGIYILKSDLSDANGQGSTAYAGAIPWGVTSSSPCHLSMMPDGKVLISDYSDGHPGIWVMDPSNPTTAFRSVFDPALTASGTGGILVNGSGEKVGSSVGHAIYDGTKLYATFEDFAPTGGAANTLWQCDWDGTSYINKPLSVMYSNSPQRIYTTDHVFDFDANGGIWLGNYRSMDGASNPSILSFTVTNGTTAAIGYNSSGAHGTNQRGALAISCDKAKMAVPFVKEIDIYTLGATTATSPTLTTRVYVSDEAANAASYGIKQIGFDVAGNVYAVSDHTKRLRVWELPNATNACTVPAPSAQKIVMTAINNLTVTLNPSTAKWSVDNGSSWNASGASAPVVADSTVVVSFNGVSGKVAPKPDVVTVTGDTALSYSYTDPVARNNWKVFGNYTLPLAFPASTAHIATDLNSNLYVGGYGHTGVYVTSSQENAAVVGFPANGKTAPTTEQIKVYSPRSRYYEGWANTLGVQQNTNGYTGLALNPVDGKMLFSMDGSPGSPSFTVKMSADGTTDTEWASGGVYDYSLKDSAINTPRYQATATLEDGTLLLGDLFCATNPYIKVISPTGEDLGTITLTGTLPNHIRDMNATLGTNGAASIFFIANGYKTIYRVDVNMNDLGRPYPARALVTTTATTGGLHYDAVTNSLLHSINASNLVNIYDADTGILRQTGLTQTTPNDSTIVTKNGGADELIYSISTTRVVSVAKREGFLKVTLTGAPAGAKWSVDGVTWNNSAITQSLFAGETYTVQFKPVAGYLTPEPQVIGANLPLYGVYATTLTPGYVRPAATLQEPADGAAVRDLTSQTVTFSWTGNSNSDLFRIVLAKKNTDTYTNSAVIHSVATYDATSLDLTGSAIRDEKIALGLGPQDPVYWTVLAGDGTMIAPGYFALNEFAKPADPGIQEPFVEDPHSPGSFIPMPNLWPPVTPMKTKVSLSPGYHVLRISYNGTEYRFDDRIPGDTDGSRVLGGLAPGSLDAAGGGDAGAGFVSFTLASDAPKFYSISGVEAPVSLSLIELE